MMEDVFYHYVGRRARLKDQSGELNNLAAKVIKDFQAAQLLIQSKHYEELQRLLHYIETGKRP